MIEVGMQLGPYEVVSQLGAGGMGEVYRAKDTRLSRTVAIKVLPAQVTDRSDLRQMGLLLDLHGHTRVSQFKWTHRRSYYYRTRPSGR